MRLKLQRFAGRLRALPLVVVAIFLAALPLAFKAVLQTNSFLAEQSAIRHGYSVIDEVDGLSLALQKARAALQSQNISSSELHKQDSKALLEAITQIVAHTDRAIFLTQDSPEQQQRLNALRHLIQPELDNMHLALLPNHPVTAGATYDSEIQPLLAAAKSAELRTLQEHEARVSGFARQMKINAYMGLLALALVVAIFFLVMKRGDREQHRSEQIASSARTELESSLLRLERETESIRLFNDLQQNFQICYTAAEAHEIIAKYLMRLFPEANGSLATINNSRNIMETVVSWGNDEGLKGQAFTPEDCCALRGGRMYSYASDLQVLACRHFAEQVPDVYVCLPLIALGETLGILHINCPDAVVLSPARLRPLQQIVEQAAMTLANLNLRAKLQDQSIRDPLTGLFNRRYLEITLEREIRRSARKQTGVGIIMADGDKFKLFNDTFGHEAGDLVLKEIASVLRRSVRSEDVVCRYGGEEFVVVLSDCSAEIVQNRAELMRSSISKLHLEHSGRSLGKITASFGVSFCQDGSVPSDRLVRLADEALYRAKAEGRNRVVMSESSPASPALLPDKTEEPGVAPLAETTGPSLVV